MSDNTVELDSLLALVGSKRAKVVIRHIWNHGYITTDDLSSKYGYKHPPRAIRDVREAGIPLTKKMIKSDVGKRMALYEFGDMNNLRFDRVHGRKVIPKKIKKKLAKKQGNKCSICLLEYDTGYLQIDHRIPYEVGGDTNNFVVEDTYMLVCAECNRAKSWACEHCDNWNHKKIFKICTTCYWGSPENYDHVAETALRRLDIVWSGNEIEDYEIFMNMSKKVGKSLPDFVKSILKKFINI